MKLIEEKPADVMEYVLAYCAKKLQGRQTPRTNVEPLIQDEIEEVTATKSISPRNRVNRISSLNSLIRTNPIT
jgi:hypothetical protein